MISRLIASILCVFLAASCTTASPARPASAANASAANPANPAKLASAARPAIEEIPPAGDYDLDELRRLAVNAPISELFEKRMMFLANVLTDYRRDPWLWRGMERLAIAALGTREFEQRRMFCIALAQSIDRGDLPWCIPAMPWADELRAEYPPPARPPAPAK